MLFSEGSPTVRTVPLVGDVNNGRGYARVGGPRHMVTLYTLCSIMLRI